MNNYRFGRVVPIIPGLLLLVWTGVQLWTMTWAYNPPLPVATAQLAALPMTHVINKPLNEFVTLLGYDSRLDQQSQLLQVDLLWQARAVSPVDYLTELRLVDSMGGLQAEWLGYSAGGRYPTRAWDAGDSVRDMVWLPTGGLDPGQYSLELKLLPNTVTTQDNSSPAESFSLGSVTLPDATSPVFSKSLPFIGDAQAAGYSLWQDGQAVRQPRLFRYRETILVSLSPLRSEQKRIVELVGVGSAAGYSFSPIRHSDTSALFIVGPAWPGGDYQLQVVIAGTGQQGQQAESEPLVRVVDRWERDFNEPVLQHRVEANFANQVRLLGYELVNNRASPGGGVPVTLYWQGLDWLGDDYTMFTKLLAADQTVHGGRDRLPRESYRTLYWAPQEIVSDSFGVPINEDAPEGVYYLNLGLYKEVDGQAVSLPLMNGDQLLDDTSLNIGPIKIGAAPARFLVETVDPQVAVNHPFGANADLTLLGYDLTDETDQPIQNLKPKIQNLKLTLYWRSERILPTDYTTFVHLRNAVGEVVAQKDQPPLQGAYPTSLWDPGEIIADELIVPLPDKLPLGEYQIVIGMYDFQTGHRLMVSESDANEVVLAAF